MTTHAHEPRTAVLTHARARRQAHDLLEQVGGRVETLSVEVESLTAPVPRELTDVISRVLEVMAQGGTVVIGSLPDELTTTAAAEQLGVSRPTLMRMIRDGEITAHKVGTHHRLRTPDVLAFKRKRLERQRQAFEDLRALEDELDMF
ncbi:MAG: helix-turn-helix domain-containing protein [Aeromicrobium sp.]|uniref:helix-turn-helix domain-containing protein n=1 Tax=Aeromicrobium sp. TaxID=1871063 RepID=UPI0039E2D0A1